MFAFLATFLGIIGFVIAILVKKKDEYVMYYAKQSLGIFIVSIVIYIVSSIVAFIPILGSLILWVVQIIMLILWILSWVYALSGKMKEVPVIGAYSLKWFKGL